MWRRKKVLQNADVFRPVHGRDCLPNGAPGWWYARASRDPERSAEHPLEHAVEPTAERLWDDVSRRLRETLNETTYATWFQAASGGSLSDEAFLVVVPNDFTREWIESHFLGLLRAATRDVLGREVRIALRVAEEPEPTEPLVATAPAVNESQPGTNPKYTFDNFVIGSSNRFAHAAALAVAEAPAQAYNPLFIYGGTGLGKTHLLQAIGAYVNDHAKKLTTRYVTSETFTNDFINSLRDKRIEGFKHRYRAYDVLLVDDIQFLEGKERFQEEFFHTFNSLYEAGRQIVISSDRPPKEIATLEERLRSRFEWGLITDIQPPDLETRIAILRKKVTTDGIAVTDPEVLTFIAGRVSTNIRELEGALTRVVAFSSLTGLPLDVELAEQVLRDLFPSTRRPSPGDDRAHPGGRLRAVLAHGAGALQPSSVAGGGLPAPGRDVPLARADRLVAAEDREGVRRPRPHDRPPREREDHPPDL